jgi:hypothetical protein
VAAVGMTDRELIEAELTETQRIALGEVSAALGIPRESWRSVPALAHVFETVAVARYAARLRQRPRVRLSKEFCERLAAETLGLEHKTVSNRRYRWRLLASGTE